MAMAHPTPDLSVGPVYGEDVRENPRQTRARRRTIMCVLFFPPTQKEALMRRIVGPLAAAMALTVLMATPALAATVTRSVTLGRTTITCVITYTELNDTNRIDTLAEVRTISDIACTVTRS